MMWYRLFTWLLTIALSPACTKKVATIAPILHLAPASDSRESDLTLTQFGFKFFEGDTSQFDRDTTVIRLGVELIDQDRDTPIRSASITAHWNNAQTEAQVIQLQHSNISILVIDRVQLESKNQIILTTTAKGYESIIKTINLPKQATRRIVAFPVRMKNLLISSPAPDDLPKEGPDAISDDAKLEKRFSLKGKRPL